MVSHLPSLDKLIHELSKLPGIGPKTASRLAYHLLRISSEDINALRLSLQGIKEFIKECTQCFSYTENEDICKFCADPHRQDDLICVVESPSDIQRIENSGVFKGRYHVLHGAISPLEGVGPEDLKIPQLLEKLRKDQTDEKPAREVILALDADLEGDTTVLYLGKALREMGVSSTRIAHGVPFGGDIDYIDPRTLGRAIENRVQL